VEIIGKIKYDKYKVITKNPIISINGREIRIERLIGNIVLFILNHPYLFKRKEKNGKTHFSMARKILKNNCRNRGDVFKNTRQKSKGQYFSCFHKH